MTEQKKQFSQKVVIFLVLYFAFFSFFNKYAFSIMKGSMEIFKNDVVSEKYLNSKENKKIENYFLGSSQVKNGINPMYIDNAYNFGHGGERYVESYCKLMALLDKGASIENIFISYDFSDFTKDSLAFEGLKLNYYEGCIPIAEMSEFRKENFISTYIKSKFPIIGNGENFVISQFGLYSPHKNNKLGWNNNDKILDLDDKMELSKLNSLVSKDNNVHPLSLKYFLQIIDLAKNNNINIFLIRYPMHKIYIDSLNIQINEVLEQVNKELNSRVNENDYILLNYFDLFVDKPNFFKDYVHVNTKGAEALSIKINEDIKNTK